MTGLNELYQELILDHNRRPHNFGRMEAPDRSAEGYNPLCGDRLTVFLRIEDDVISDVMFEGSGCAISKASASMMTDSLKGRTLDEARRLFETFHGMLTGTPPGEEESAGLGKLVVFAGVGEFPVRVKCATLAWHTARAALDGSREPVSTE